MMSCRAGEIDTIATDKTGTLTSGFFSVQDVLVTDHEECDEEIEDPMLFAASLEAKSSHPLASAIVTRFTGCIAEATENDLLRPVQRYRT